MGCHGDGIGRRLPGLPDGALQPVSWHQVARKASPRWQLARGVCPWAHAGSGCHGLSEGMPRQNRGVVGHTDTAALYYSEETRIWRGAGIKAGVVITAP